MTSTAMKNELLHHVSRLPAPLQSQVLQFAKALEIMSHAGVAGSNLMSFAGCIPSDDLKAITMAIEEDCERVDANEW